MVIPSSSAGSRATGLGVLAYSQSNELSFRDFEEERRGAEHSLDMPGESVHEKPRYLLDTLRTTGGDTSVLNFFANATTHLDFK